jgi:hypothetical protein
VKYWRQISGLGIGHGKRPKPKTSSPNTGFMIGTGTVSGIALSAPEILESNHQLPNE